MATTLKLITILLITTPLITSCSFISTVQGLSFGGAATQQKSPSIIKRHQAKKNKADKMTQLQANLAFTCKHEAKPKLSTETQQLYNYALYHDLHLMWKGKKGDWNNDLIRYYRIAAAHGDYKANIRLQYLLKSGRIASGTAQTEVYNLNKALAKQLPATAYYNLYGYLDVGYGVRTKRDGQYAYLRKAADLGSPEAQYVVADMLGDINDKETLQMRLKIIGQLRSCASEQGLGDASEMLGIRLQREEKYQKALEIFHQGTKNGNDSSARRLSDAFSGKPKEGDMYFLNLAEDQERFKRYKIIARYLSDNDYLKPKVPDLDAIVPLPPAPLPKWDGKIAFQRWFEGEAPPKPDEELVHQLAEQAGLNTKTGLDAKTGLPKNPIK